MEDERLDPSQHEAIKTLIGPLQEFRHTELSSTASIRLIKIHLELIRGDISCTLQQYESSSSLRPEYIALSYVWGDSTPRHIVYINGHLHKLHHSLWQFLERKRTDATAQSRWFWTDLLCINQAHHSEKHGQILRMGDIYTEAEYVISWLGESTPTVDALRTIVQMTEHVDVDPQNVPKYPWRSSESAQIHNACDQMAFREPYWERVWVLQEVACAKSCFVAAGEIVVKLEDFLQKMEIAMNRSARFQLSSDRDRRMKHIREVADLKMSIQGGKSMKMVELIERTSHCRATLDQDRIYGLLGLISRLDSGFDRCAIEVSYEKKLSDIWWEIIAMVLDDEPGRGTGDDLEAIKRMVTELPPPRQHLKPDMGATSIRKFQAETACQVSEAAYSISVQEYLDIVVSDLEYDRDELERQFRVRDRWTHAIKHAWGHRNRLPLNTKAGRAAFAGLMFTSWHSGAEQMSETLVDRLPTGWFCAAHVPDHLRNTTSKNCISPNYEYGIDSDYSSIGTQDPLHSVHCSAAGQDMNPCDLSSAVLKITQLGITCRVERARTVNIDFYCDCCEPDTSLDVEVE